MVQSMNTRRYTVIGFMDYLESGWFTDAMTEMKPFLHPQMILESRRVGPVEVLFLYNLTASTLLGRTVPQEFEEYAEQYSNVYLLNDRAVEHAKRLGIHLPVLKTIEANEELVAACGTLLRV